MPILLLYISNWYDIMDLNIHKSDGCDRWLFPGKKTDDEQGRM